MNSTEKEIIRDYRRVLPYYSEIEPIATRIINDILKDNGINTLLVSHRLKTEESLTGKLFRTAGKYASLSQITDVLGMRIVCYFSDDIDRIGDEIGKRFTVDYENTVDKRKKLNVDAFGYLSLHYICMLPQSEEYGEELTKHKFEIQIRTALQHTWSEIEHNIGYKNEFGIPKDIRRNFSRMAGLLEIADDQFVNMRNGIDDYNAECRNSIAENTAGNLPINTVTLNEFMRLNKPMRELIERIAAINGAEVIETDAVAYIKQLAWLGITTLGGLEAMLRRNCEEAYKIAYDSLKDTDLDILSCIVGLRYLCGAELINGGYTEEQAGEFYLISTRNEERSRRCASMLFTIKKLAH